MRARAALALATLLALTGCSDDGGSTDTDGTAATPTSPATGGDTTAAPADTGGEQPGTDAPTTTVGVTSTVPVTAGMVVPQVVASGFERPVDVAWRPGDDGTMFVVSQAGAIYPVAAEGTVGGPVLELGRITNEGEQGLLGLTFHPTEPLAYVNYTDAQGDTVVAEYQVADDGTFSAERVVITIPQPHGNHNGGAVAFGPDGFLYIGMGDGGAADDPDRRALDVGDLLGKILRIDPTPSGGAGYTVPADNPYVGTAGARPEIWAIGVRNPWRFSFDPDSGDLWVADVGQAEWEEVNVARATDGSNAGRGVNFGWSAWEGTHRFNEDQTADGSLLPVHEYAHGDDGCSVSGGAVYRGGAVPSLQGWYLFSDFCSGKVWALPASSEPGAAGTVVVLTSVPSVSAVIAGPDGEVYVLSHTDGTVNRLVAA